MKKILLVLLIGALLTGCAHNPMVWNKPALSQAEFNRDNYDCIQQSRTQWVGGGFGLIGLAIMISAKANAEEQSHQLYCRCMESRGYSGYESGKEK